MIMDFEWDDEPIPPQLEPAVAFELANRRRKNLFFLVARMFTRDDIRGLPTPPIDGTPPYSEFREYFDRNFENRTFLSRDYHETFNLPRELFGRKHTRINFRWRPWLLCGDIDRCFYFFIRDENYLPYFGIIRYRWSKLTTCVGADHTHAAIKKFMEILKQFSEEQAREYGTGVLVEFSEALYSYCKMLVPENRLALAMGQHSRLGASSLIRTLPPEAVELIMNVYCPITKATFGEYD